MSDRGFAARDAAWENFKKGYKDQSLGLVREAYAYNSGWEDAIKLAVKLCSDAGFIDAAADILMENEK